MQNGLIQNGRRIVNRCKETVSDSMFVLTWKKTVHHAMIVMNADRVSLLRDTSIMVYRAEHVYMMKRTLT